jgi:hypothetical protein
VAGQCPLKKGFGVFYEGRCRAFLLDSNGDKTEEMREPVGVAPLRPLEFAKWWVVRGDEKVPVDAAKVALCVYDTKGEPVGEPARAEIHK